MSVIPYSQSWDGTVSGWNASGTWTLKQSAPYPVGVSPTSSPGMLVGSASSGTIWYTYGTADDVGGEVVVQSNAIVSSSGTPGVVGVFARGSAATATGSTSQYAGWYDSNTGEVGITLYSGGSSSDKATMTPVAAPTGWGQLSLKLSGSSLSLSLKDRGNGQWLNAAGGWQSTQTTCLTATDSTLSGAGYFGEFARASYGSFTGYYDDFSATSSVTVDGATAAVTLGAMAGVGSGTFATHASAAITTGGATAAATAANSSTASAAITTGHATCSAPATVFIAVSAGITLGATAASAPGTFRTTAAPAVTLGSLVITASAFGPSMATANITTGNHHAAVLGNNGCFATATPTMGGLGSAGSAFSGYFGAAGITLGGLGVSASATWANTAAVSLTLGAITPAAVGTFTASGVGATALGPLGISTYAFAGAFAVNVNIALGGIAASGAGIFGAFAHPAVTLGNHAVVASASQSTTGSAAITLAPTWMWGGSVSVGYFLYASPAAGEAIDYDHPIGVTSSLTFTTATGLLGPGDWRFGVRAANANGLEQNLDCSLEVDVGSDGSDITGRPDPPNNLRAHAAAGGSIVVAWSAAAVTVAAKKPTSFAVYIGTGSTPNYATPAATVTYGSSIAGAYQTTLSGLSDGVAYVVGVRASNASGNDGNTNSVSVTADSTGPSAVGSLTASAIV